MPKGLIGKTSILHITTGTFQFLSYVAKTFVKRQPHNHLRALRLLVTHGLDDGLLAGRVDSLAEQCEMLASSPLAVHVNCIDWQSDRSVESMLESATLDSVISSIVMSDEPAVGSAESFSRTLANFQRDQRSVVGRPLPMLKNAPFVDLSHDSATTDTGMLANQEIRRIIAYSTQVVAKQGDVIPASPQVLDTYMRALLQEMNYGLGLRSRLNLDEAVARLDEDASIDVAAANGEEEQPRHFVRP
ncbi:MAG: hypothetical protein CMF50_03015 [Legionellales bacterium]|nr:hypothetical protein [Legionellales bacterium]|tara:strand:- start:25093 stop:25827 length:735 start_codon:yes stop_codon:yes gene_type:complete